MSKKTKNGQRKSLLTGASVLAAAAAAMAGTPAFAQDAEEEEAIVVTGTRLARQDFEAISPVTTVGAEQLELTATLTTESLLNELPQIIPGNTRTSNNAGGFDYATVDLRGLGPGRTLVLVNGERVPVSSTAGAVDINTIPASLISRVEVVTGRHTDGSFYTTWEFRCRPRETNLVVSATKTPGSRLAGLRLESRLGVFRIHAAAGPKIYREEACPPPLAGASSSHSPLRALLARSLSFVASGIACPPPLAGASSRHSPLRAFLARSLSFVASGIACPPLWLERAPAIHPSARFSREL